MSDLSAPCFDSPVTVLTTNHCGFCRRLVAKLDDAKVPYHRIDADANPEYDEWIMSVNNGNRIVPTVVYSDGTHATNPPAEDVIARYRALA